MLSSKVKYANNLKKKRLTQPDLLFPNSKTIRNVPKVKNANSEGGIQNPNNTVLSIDAHEFPTMFLAMENFLPQQFVRGS